MEVAGRRNGAVSPIAVWLSLEAEMESRFIPLDSSRRKPKEIIITLYKNGYQEKGGTFCKKDDSDEHKRAYESLIEGYVPREYEARVRNEGVRVVVDDRRQEEYHAPPPRFGYVGNRLGTATSYAAVGFPDD